MRKWQKIWNEAIFLDSECLKGEYVVKMRGKSKLLFFYFMLWHDKKTVTEYHGINRWIFDWGRFLVYGMRFNKGYSDTNCLKLDYDQSKNARHVRRIVDLIRWSNEMNCWIGKFLYRVGDKYRQLSWFTLTSTERANDAELLAEIVSLSFKMKRIFKRRRYNGRE